MPLLEVVPQLNSTCNWKSSNLESLISSGPFPGLTKLPFSTFHTVVPGNGPELINDSKFEDFQLHVEFNCGATSNSGIYLRGRYEVQVETDSIEEPPSH